ncbi:hypothetical protein GQ457_09G029310 [Hibiscus cannabinus]
MKSAFHCSPPSKGFRDTGIRFPTLSSLGNMRSEQGNAKFAPRSCAIDDRYAFMKSGKSYASKDHPHPLTFTRKVYDYPECHICRRHCDDLSVECRQSRCNYIDLVHLVALHPSF